MVAADELRRDLPLRLRSGRVRPFRFTPATLRDREPGRGCGGGWEGLAVRITTTEHHRDLLRLWSCRARSLRSTAATLCIRIMGRGCGGGVGGNHPRQASPRPPRAPKPPGPPLPPESSPPARGRLFRRGRVLAVRGEIVVIGPLVPPGLPLTPATPRDRGRGCGGGWEGVAVVGGDHSDGASPTVAGHEGCFGR